VELLHAAAAVAISAAVAAAIAMRCTRLMVIVWLPLVCAGVEFVAHDSGGVFELTIIFEINKFIEA
jgi:hypothetical protein